MAAFYTFEDYSGTSTPSTSENPYDGLIEACNNDPVSHDRQSRLFIIYLMILNLIRPKYKHATTPTAMPEQSSNEPNSSIPHSQA